MQQTNCHPFRRGRWLFVHNGYIADFHLLRRELMLGIAPELFAEVHGSTDTEVVFYLALTLGLEREPVAALERAVGVIEQMARRHGIAGAVQATFGVSDGESVWAVRYATEGPARSLFASADVDSIRHLHPDNPRFQRLSPDDRLIVSEPFSDLPGVWQEIPGRPPSRSGAAACWRSGPSPRSPPAERRPVAAESPGLGDAFLPRGLQAWLRWSSSAS